ncbi:TetR/AcrR family transcriptional regulator [bacterium]|nr:TetR/AcrR family transcriptional regulator [bacterium]MBU1918994.1 TetR/AcrR family transcriptional regulator [bacterium]
MSLVREQKNQERKDNTRKALLSAATKVFARQGYHNTLISDVVQEACVGQGTFYRNFTDKRAIFAALKDEFILSLLNEFQPMSEHLPESFEDYREASVQAITKLARKLDENKDFVMCFFKEAPAVDKEFSTEVALINDQFVKLAKLYLDHAIAQGFARKCNAHVVSEAIVGMGQRMIMQWLEDKIKDVELEHLVEEMVDFGFLGLKL